MAPLKDSTPFGSTDASNSTSSMAQDTDTTLPGMKRGIAIGVACSVTIVFILLLAIFAIRRRRNLARLDQQKKDGLANKIVFEEVWWQETTKKMTQPSNQVSPAMEPSPIYELDGSSEAEQSPNRMSNQMALQQTCCLLNQGPNEHLLTAPGHEHAYQDSSRMALSPTCLSGTIRISSRPPQVCGTCGTLDHAH
ncbi:hypothetical protein J1614_011546 [Plenodomus biglobosus]|nr:hypothetical protein J1614_011546 [Plenodomus biglobosus]